MFALGGFAIDLASDLIGDALSNDREIVVGPCPGSPSLSAWVTMWRAATPAQRQAVANAYVSTGQETQWGHGPFQPETEAFLKIAFGGDDCKQSPNNLNLYNPVLAIIQSQGGAQVMASGVTSGGSSLGDRVTGALEEAGRAAVAAGTGSLAGTASTEFNRNSDYTILPDWVPWLLGGIAVVALIVLFKGR